MKPAQKIATLRIDSLAAGGAGVGKLEGGLVVFVPHTAPDDRVEVEVEVRAGARSAEGKLLRVLEPSPERVTPPCPYVTSCGGCDWMHLHARAQEEGHVAIVRSAIAREAKGAALPEIQAHRAASALAYRTRARLFARAEGRRVNVGYRAPSSRALAAIDACMVLDPRLTPLIGELARVLEGAKGEGDALIGLGQGGLPVVEILWKGEIAAPAWAAIDDRIARGVWAGARVTLEGANLPATFGDPHPIMVGADGAPLWIAPGGFAQPSDQGAAVLAGRVAELSRLAPPIWKEAKPRHVVELFAGSGTLSILLAQGTASFTAVEIDPEAAACARRNLAERGLAGKVTAGAAAAFSLPPRTEIVVLDPPRAGASEAMAAIVASSARAVVYVSCDPPTLGRDLGVLVRAGFALTHIETFEIFPQTSHVETVVRAVRTKERR